MLFRILICIILISQTMTKTTSFFERICSDKPECACKISQFKTLELKCLHNSTLPHYSVVRINIEASKMKIDCSSTDIEIDVNRYLEHSNLNMLFFYSLSISNCKLSNQNIEWESLFIQLYSLHLNNISYTDIQKFSGIFAMDVYLYDCPKNNNMTIVNSMKSYICAIII